MLDRIMERDNKNHTLLYTTTDRAVIYPSINECEYHEKIVSNTYKNGVGKMAFKDEITSIPNGLFADCANLQTIEIPSSCTVIHDHAFSGCFNLEKVKLNDGLRAVLEYAFARTKLRTIEIPASCFIVASFAFAETPLRILRLNKPTAAYRYLGNFVVSVECRIEGISKYDDFCLTSFGFNDNGLIINYEDENR